jgi:hypothetical protein
MRTLRLFSVIGLLVAILTVACSHNDLNRTDRQQTAISVTLLKTSLAATIQKVTMAVTQNGAIVHRDTVDVVDGEFAFPSFDLEAGNATFSVNALNSLNQVVYTKNTTVNIEPGRNNTISLQLLPAVPMVKLSPYYSESQTGSAFVSHIELFNIAKFHSGEFQVDFDRTAVRFDSIRPSNTAWGSLADTARNLRTYLDVTVTRLGSDDAAPTSVPALVDLWFTALSAGVTELTVSTKQMVDNNGTVAELGDSTFVADGQTVSITQVSSYGLISGSVNNAVDGGALDSVDVNLAGPVQRSTRTNSDGVFSFAELPYGTYQVSATKAGFIQNTKTVQLLSSSESVEFVLTPVLDPNQYRAVLTWGQEPNDLDLHLWTLQTEIYFGHKGSLTESPYAILDVDDQSGYGPETITIGQLLDTCKFSVHNYSRTPEITTSRAHIDFYKGDTLLKSFDIPTAGTGEWWYVFDLTPTGTIIDRNAIVESNPALGRSSQRPLKMKP